MSGTLTLIPTPIDEDSPLEKTAFDLLDAASKDLDNNIIMIEDLKPCRRRWLKWGLTRDVVEDFVLFNEHTQEKLVEKYIPLLKSGKNIYLMSDGGLPAFCDPGQLLVKHCHMKKIKVTSAPFCNSISLAVSLSGIDCSNFLFAGFLPRKTENRKERLSELLESNIPVLLMDTPYRLNKLVEEIRDNGSKRKIFLALDLNSFEEELLYGSAASLLKKIKSQKREFILIIE